MPGGVGRDSLLNQTADIGSLPAVSFMDESNEALWPGIGPIRSDFILK
jgi:hypothetical protein